jgi:outer membrane protein OmpA-like peptidoglycan-associated protein
MRRMACVMAGGLLLASCTTANPDGTQSVSKAGVGGAIGAVTGGLLGNRIDDRNRGRGTAVGAILGAATGAGVGHVMDRQEQELREQIAAERMAHAIQVERVEDDLLKLTLANEVSFAFDRAEVDPAFVPTLEKLADVLSRYDQNMVTVVGHTDSIGSDAYTENLSLRRAEAVVQELALAGVPRSRMSAIGMGKSEPRATNETAHGRQLNRRVEILVQPVA